MARTLDQILTELNSVYSPSAQNIQSQMDLIPQQTQASISAADAAQQKAYKDILSGAQQRGLGFSGIPLGEQANYASTVYAPAVLQAKTQGQQNVLTLQDALNKLNLSKYDLANQMRQQELDNEFKQQQLNAQRAAAYASSSWNPTYGGGQTGNNPPAVTHTPEQEALWRQMTMKPGGGLYSDQELVNDFQRTYISAQYGNQRDKQKLDLYYSVRPDLFNPEIAKGIKMPQATPKPGQIKPLGANPFNINFQTVRA